MMKKAAGSRQQRGVIIIMGVIFYAFILFPLFISMLAFFFLIDSQHEMHLGHENYTLAWSSWLITHPCLTQQQPPPNNNWYPIETQSMSQDLQSQMGKLLSSHYFLQNLTGTSLGNNGLLSETYCWPSSNQNVAFVKTTVHTSLHSFYTIPGVAVNGYDEDGYAWVGQYTFNSFNLIPEQMVFFIDFSGSMSISADSEALGMQGLTGIKDMIASFAKNDCIYNRINPGFMEFSSCEMLAAGPTQFSSGEMLSAGPQSSQLPNGGYWYMQTLSFSDFIQPTTTLQEQWSALSTLVSSLSINSKGGTDIQDPLMRLISNFSLLYNYPPSCSPPSGGSSPCEFVDENNMQFVLITDGINNEQSSTSSEGTCSNSDPSSYTYTVFVNNENSFVTSIDPSTKNNDFVTLNTGLESTDGLTNPIIFSPWKLMHYMPNDNQGGLSTIPLNDLATNPYVPNSFLAPFGSSKQSISYNYYRQASPIEFHTGATNSQLPVIYNDCVSTISLDTAISEIKYLRLPSSGDINSGNFGVFMVYPLPSDTDTSVEIPLQVVKSSLVLDQNIPYLAAPLQQDYTMSASSLIQGVLDVADTQTLSNNDVAFLRIYGRSFYDLTTNKLWLNWPACHAYLRTQSPYNGSKSALNQVPSIRLRWGVPRLLSGDPVALGATAQH